MKSAAQEVGRTERAKSTKRRNESLRSAILAGMELLDAISGNGSPSQNKLKLLESTGFLSFCNRMVLLSIEKPQQLYQDAMVAILKLLETLCGSSLQISKSVIDWE